MKGALMFALCAAIVAGGSMAVTLSVGHQLGHGWSLVAGAAGAGGMAGLVLGMLAWFAGRARQQA